MTNAAVPVWAHAASTPDKPAVQGSGRVMTYAGLRQRASDVAADLVAHGVRAGDRVLLVAPSVPEFAAALFGIYAAGAVAVTVNTMSTRAELEYVLDDAECVLVLAWAGCDTAARLAADTHRTRCVILDPELPGATAAVVLSEPASSADDDDALLIYTSGTTGRPKGAQLTHGNLLSCARGFVEVFEATADDRIGTALPLFHVFGLTVTLGTAVTSGAVMVLLSPFEPRAALDMIRVERLTVFAGVPTMYNALLQESDLADPADFPDLRLCVSGGASLPAQVIRSFSDTFGIPLLEGYGLTETAGSATFNGLRRARRAGFVGLPMPDTDIRITDDDGCEVARGELGEVRIRGPQVMAGYWRRPEESAEALRAGWLLTGDIGRMDSDGDLEIVDRKKDLVIRGGYNVYPREIEEALYCHPDIVEAAVIGVPDPRYGEEVAAVIVVRPGIDLANADLRAWLKERLSAYKVPRVFAVVDELPKGSTGKVLKRAIDRTTLVDSPRRLP